MSSDLVGFGLGWGRMKCLGGKEDALEPSLNTHGCMWGVGHTRACDTLTRLSRAGRSFCRVGVAEGSKAMADISLLVLRALYAVFYFCFCFVDPRDHGDGAIRYIPSPTTKLDWIGFWGGPSPDNPKRSSHLTNFPSCMHPFLNYHQIPFFYC